ncbi:DUF6571 family protein [Streptomyces johnsoniae]|uniref:DUF6571 domain-containing protein n=1 Tax=Streptomyces johnsoniae TaxID=3075532 RepID=A0ABU2S1E8_9ACTN|nr:DUF6571 family protein [Streptomyces sp. DSM 41886]MDT0441614.1 hypothetical protein [Streptomyces sp. DSM 41886]
MSGRGAIAFEEVLHLQLGKLEEAIGEWDTQVQRLESMKENAAGMARRTRSASWAGANADVTIPFVTEQADQFDAAHKQARTLRELCRDGHGRLKHAKDRLTNLVEIEAPELGVHVSATGQVTSDLEGLDAETRRARQDAVVEVSGRITDILRTVAEDDAEIAQALRAAMGTDPDRFTAVEYTSVQQATLAREDADALMERMARGEELPDDELHDIALLLELHADDPAFAERIATGLGPQGVLDFWTDVSRSRDQPPGSSEWESAAALQTSLGQVLGTATQSDSAAMDAWERDMTALGDERVGGPDGPYGFQTMSALMHRGDYDTDFLLEYGDALLTFEREDDRSPAQLWDSDPSLRLNFVESAFPGGEALEGDWGRDPVVGFMQGLGHNPEASTQFFAPPDDYAPTDTFERPPNRFDPADDNEQVNAHLDYLATDREWWLSNDHHGGPDPLNVHPAFGDALFAAATGREAGGFDGDDLDGFLATGDRRTADTAAVMSQVMHLYGSREPNLLAGQPEMAADLAAMTGLYMDDINYAMSGQTEGARAENGQVFGSAYEDRLDNGFFNTARFLNVLGQEETGHGVLTQAQELYTAGVLAGIEPTGQEAYDGGVDAIRTSAEVRGLLDQSLVARIEHDFGEQSKEAERALAQSSGWAKAGGGALVGAGLGGLALVTGGTAAAAVAVPIAAGATPPLIGEFMNQSIDDFSRHEADDTEVRMSRMEFYSAGETATTQLKETFDETIEESLPAGSTIDDSAADLHGAYRLGRDLISITHGPSTPGN